MGAEQKIKAYLKSVNMSLSNFSLLTKISLSKLSLSLNGHRRLTLAEYEIVCYALGVGVDKFLEPRKPKNKKGE